MEEALKALRAKNILPGEPAVAYYKDASYGQSALVAVGDTHNSNNPYIFGADTSTVLNLLSEVKALISIDTICSLYETFYNCISLKSFDMPNLVGSFNLNNMFKNDTDLETLTFGDMSSCLLMSENYTFANCFNLKYINQRQKADGSWTLFGKYYNYDQIKIIKFNFYDTRWGISSTNVASLKSLLDTLTVHIFDRSVYGSEYQFIINLNPKAYDNLNLKTWTLDGTVYTAVGNTFLDDLKSKGYTVTSLANQNY